MPFQGHPGPRPGTPPPAHPQLSNRVPPPPPGYPQAPRYLAPPTGPARYPPPRQLPAGPTAPPPRSPLHRNRDEAWLAGVASGIARHLGWPIWLIRLSLVGLVFSTPLTVAVYGVLWMLLPDAPEREQPPGLQAASHQGLRSEQAPKPRQKANLGRITAMVMIGGGIILLVQNMGLGVTSALFWPLLLAAIGVTLVWSQAEGGDEPTAAPSGVPQWLVPLLGSKRWAATARVIVGMGLVGAAISMLAASRIGVSQLPVVLWVAGLTLAGVGVVAVPWVIHYRRKLDAAREAQLIADTRADMAAHLHDSVLQTLALIQRQADDPKQVASLARRQERELRTWLYADTDGPGTLKAALTAAGGEVEDERGVAVEVVCVGDIDLTPDLRAMVQAAREAMMNAAKHSQAELIDVYAEVDRDADPAIVQVFVRDRGQGFNMDEIADDRMGVRGSIVGRMERHGGSATVRSAPGEGTEIRLEMKAS